MAAITRDDDAEIPDKEYQPSLLHERLLQLPWTDVFTTNYDTLLERTAEKILQHRYETVINKEEMKFKIPFTFSSTEILRKKSHGFVKYFRTNKKTLLSLEQNLKNADAGVNKDEYLSICIKDLFIAFIIFITIFTSILGLMQIRQLRQLIRCRR